MYRRRSLVPTMYNTSALWNRAHYEPNLRVTHLASVAHATEQRPSARTQHMD